MINNKLFGSFVPVAISWAATIWRMPVMYLGPFMSSLFS